MSKGSNNGKGFLLGALIGSAVGAVTALLLAPKPGAELRQDIGEGTKKALNKADEFKDTVQEKTGEYTEKAREVGSDLKDKSADLTRKAVDSTTKFTKEVTEKTKEVAQDV